MLLLKNEKHTVNYFKAKDDDEPDLYITGQDTHTVERTYKSGEKFEIVSELSINELRTIVGELRKLGKEI